MPQHLQPCRRQEQQPRQLGLGMAAELAVQRPAATGRSGRKYREGRRDRLRPADGESAPRVCCFEVCVGIRVGMWRC